MVPSATVVRAGIFLARWVPPTMLRALARGAGGVAWALSPTRRAVARENVARLSPQAGGAASERLAQRLLPNLLEAAVDLWRIPSMPRKVLEDLVAVEGIEHLHDAIADGHGVILATGHLGPYELAGVWLAAQGFPVHAMVENLDQETAAALAAYRTTTNMRLIPRDAGLRPLLHVLREGGVVALVCDRMIGEGAPGVRVPWGTGAREVPVGPATLARATGAPIVTGYVLRDREAPRGARYRMVLDPPIRAAGTPVDEVTQEVARRLANVAAAHPDEWYVFQPAWDRAPA